MKAYLELREVLRLEGLPPICGTGCSSGFCSIGDVTLCDVYTGRHLEGNRKEKGGQKQDVAGKKRKIIGLPGNRGMAVKVSIIFRGLVVPISLAHKLFRWSLIFFMGAILYYNAL